MNGSGDEDRGWLLPLPEQASLWTTAILGAVGGGLLLLLCLPYASGVLPIPSSPEEIPVQVVLTALGLCAGSVVSAWTWWTRVARIERSRQVAAEVGLRFSERVHSEQLERFADFPLLRVGDWKQQRAGPLIEGEFDGMGVLLMPYASTGQIVTESGSRLQYRSFQTILIVGDVGPLPEFHLAPQDCDWNQKMPGWPMILDLGEVARVIADDPKDPSVVRGREVARVRALFRADCRADLGPLEGWMIECYGGHLLLYRLAERVEPERFPRLLAKGVAVARALLQYCPGRADPGPDDPHVRPAP